MGVQTKKEENIGEAFVTIIANLVGAGVALLIIYYVICPLVYLLYLCFQ